MALNKGWVYRERVPPAADGCPVLAYLAHTRRHSSRATWAVRLAGGEVWLDGAVAAADDRLRAGQRLEWHRPPWDEPDVPLDVEVVHEDEALVAVIKPRGLPTMAAGGFLQHTLLAGVTARYPGARPLHRLGRHTSGLVIFARTRAAAARLARSWRDLSIEKDYRALGSGVPGWDERRLDVPIGAVPHPRLGTVHAASPTGRPAISVARVMARGAGETLFAVRILTGRPHQVRIHLAWCGHPLVGDPLYGPGGLPLGAAPGLPGDGGYRLHAERLSFTHPSTGRVLELHAPPPPDLAAPTEGRDPLPTRPDSDAG